MRSGRSPARRKAVLLVTHEASTGDASLRYRSFHHAESLGFLGVSCDAVRYGTSGLLDAIAEYECIVLHRVPWDAAAPILERAEALGRLVVSDTDDLVFEPTVSHEIEAIEGMSDDWRTAWHASYRRTIEACQGAIVATEPLRERARTLTSPVEVVANVVDDEMIRHAERALRAEAASPLRVDREIAVAYFSGSPTHSADFAEAAEAVLWALDTYPWVRFVAGGRLELDERFDRFASRVSRIAWHPWPAVAELQAQTHVNLAPLAPNPFSESKSCVKYLEASLVEVPTVASARGDFVRVIEHGRNGLLAEDEVGWRGALRQLIEDPVLRHELGRRAHADVHAKHTTRARLPAVEGAWRSLTGSRSTGDQPLSIDWLLDWQAGEDEVEVTLRLAHGLTRYGHVVRLCTEVGDGDVESTTARLLADSIDESVTRTVGPFAELSAVDARIATSTWTAHLLSYQATALHRFRLVCSSAEVGFELPVRHICLDEGLAGMVSGRSRRSAAWLDHAADPAEALDRFLRSACFLRLSRRPGRSPATVGPDRPLPLRSDVRIPTRRATSAKATGVAERFASLRPWQTRFVVDGQAYGGDLDYSDDERVSTFFGWFESPQTVLELSSGEGVHTLGLAARDTTERVLGLDERSDNVARARLVAELLGRGNVEFASADLETVELAAFGRFDAVFCADLLYRLTSPWRLLAEIGRVSDRLFLDTHYWSLQPTVEREGYRGSWVREGGPADASSDGAGHALWLTRPALLEALTDTGWAVRHLSDHPRWSGGPRLWLGCVRPTRAARTAA